MQLPTGACLGSVVAACMATCDVCYLVKSPGCQSAGLTPARLLKRRTDNAASLHTQPCLSAAAVAAVGVNLLDASGPVPYQLLLPPSACVAVMIPPAGPHFARLPLLYQPGMQLDVQVRDSMLIMGRTVELLRVVLLARLARLAVCIKLQLVPANLCSALYMHQDCCSLLCIPVAVHICPNDACTNHQPGGATGKPVNSPVQGRKTGQVLPRTAVGTGTV